MKSPRIVTMACAMVLGVSLAQAETLRFAVMGDSRGSHGVAVNEEVLGRIVESVLAADPPVELVIFSGDLILGGDWEMTIPEQLQLWRRMVQPWYDAGIAVYPVPGNHDLETPLTYALFWQGTFPELPDNGPPGDEKMTFSFDAGPCHFAAVNTDRPLNPHWVDLDWLADDLASSDTLFKFVIGHEPAYSAGWHVNSSLDYHPAMRDAFWQILVDNDVQAYFCGHEHIYDHWIKDGVHQIISGGAGAPGNFYHYLILDVDDEDVTVSVYTDSGELHEQYRLSETENVPNEERSNLSYNALQEFPCTALFLCILAMGITGFGAITGSREVGRHE